jgi:hypothetical protein
MADGTKILKCPHRDCGVEHVISYNVRAEGMTMQEWRLVAEPENLADVYAHVWWHDVQAAIPDE